MFKHSNKLTNLVDSWNDRLTEHSVNARCEREFKKKESKNSNYLST